ncbi:MAG: hypothetical protein U1C48_00815 [Methylotenera sp.]|nr:hypothetical protein [Methylotenera sp.]
MTHSKEFLTYSGVAWVMTSHSYMMDVDDPAITSAVIYVVRVVADKKYIVGRNWTE